MRGAIAKVTAIPEIGVSDENRIPPTGGGLFRSPYYSRALPYCSGILCYFYYFYYLTFPLFF